MEKVSIICPLYNKKRYIKDTLDSVLQQSFRNWELLIIDDGSTDGSFEYARELLCAGSESIILLKRADFTPKKGASACRNVGIRHAKGDFILFLDGDDMLAPGALENRLSTTRKYPGYSFYVFNEAYFIDDPTVIYHRTMRDITSRLAYKLAPNKKRFFLKKFLRYELPWTVSNPLWRREALLKVEGFLEDLQRLQDPELHTRILLEETISFKILKYDVPSDVYIRICPDRRYSTNMEHFNMHVDSVRQYITYFSHYLIARGRRNDVRYLKGYLLSAEETGNYYLRTAPHQDRVQYLQALDRLYWDKCIGLVMNQGYRRMVSVVRLTGRSKVFQQMKIPAILIRLYKYFI
jgi:glycosyltransferase involved in cell wall biosynthesis